MFLSTLYMLGQLRSSYKFLKFVFALVLLCVLIFARNKAQDINSKIGVMGISLDSIDRVLFVPTVSHKSRSPNTYRLT